MLLKKKVQKSVACLLSVSCFAACLTGCNLFIEEGEQVDATKMQLYVGNFNQGFGKEWLENAAERFTEWAKDKHYSDDTTGVQIFVDDMQIGSAVVNSLDNNRAEIIFNESVDYYTWIRNGNLVDITDIVKGDMGTVGESGESIYGKMYPSAQEFYEYTDGKIYGIPFHESTYGIIYDIDVFEDNALFMDTNGNFTLRSQTDPNASAGPDGDASTAIDNGLPATFSEFYALCDTMLTRGLQPLTWTGKNNNYTSRFIQSMAAYLDGYKESRVKYDLKGNAEHIIASFDGNTPVLRESTPITDQNGYLMTGTTGMYYALEFFYNLITRTVEGDHYYNESNLMSQAYDHMNAQDDFVRNGVSGKADTAMLIDGVWFLNEAKGTFDSISVSDPSKSASVRKFGLMPLPHPDGWGNTKFTYLETNQTICGVTKKATEEKMDLIKDFIQFLHTDSELQAFTETTSTLRAFDYLSDYDVENGNLTPFAKQLVSLKQYIGDDVVYPISTNNYYASNTTELFASDTMVFSSTINGRTWNEPIRAFDSGVSARDYILGMQEYHDESWWNGNILS